MHNQNCEHKAGKRFLKVLGGVVLGLFAAAIISQFHDIKRYYKISTM